MLSFQHIFRVARAVNVDPLTAIEAAVVYITDEKDAGIVAKTWEMAFEDPPKLGIILVNNLPRGASVEWHILRCRKSGYEEEMRPLTRISFDDEVNEVLHEFSDEMGALCMIFGNLKTSTRLQELLPKVLIQKIPSRAVYSLNNGSLQKRNSCIALLTG